MDHHLNPTPDIAARAVVELAHDVVTSGRQPIETPDISGAVAVHDLRKALKRWRAILRLIAPIVGEEAELMRVEARDLARELAAARDGRAAQEALADLGDELHRVSARARTSIEEKLARMGAGAEAASLTPVSKARIGHMWTRAAAAIETWPLERFDRAEAVRQLTTSYRRVRAAVPEDWSRASAEALHRLRQRVVVHRYQMELAEELWPKLMRLWVSEAQRLRDRLGAYQDLVILRRFAEPHRPLARWRSQLTPMIAQRQGDHIAAARRLAGRLLAEKPKAFGQRLVALWEHRAEGPE